MLTDSPPPDYQLPSTTGRLLALRNFVKKLPISIFFFVLLIHIAIGGWLLSARFDLTQSTTEAPIFVELLGRGQIGQDQKTAIDASPATDTPAAADSQESVSTDAPQEVISSPAAKRIVDIVLQEPSSVTPAQPSIRDAREEKPVKPAVAQQSLSKPAEQRQRPSDERSEPGAVVGTQTSQAGKSLSAEGAEGQSGPRLVSHIDYAGAPPSPIYPPRAKNRGQEGRVVVRVLVDSKGQLRNVSLLASSGFDLLDQAALAAVSKVKFKPYSENGVFYDRLADIPIDFVLKE